MKGRMKERMKEKCVSGKKIKLQRRTSYSTAFTSEQEKVNKRRKGSGKGKKMKQK